ncbi:MAG: hypothetical protein WCD35_05350 [Mycobacteriales bacterium]
MLSHPRTSAHTATASPTPPPRPRGAQLSANSPRTLFGADNRPALADLQLPGPRREREGRGGAVATADTLRLLVRSPLLMAFTEAIPRRRTGRPPAVPDVFWVFYLAAMRYFSSAEKLDQELRSHWLLVREEFWFEHEVLLPDAKANGDVPNSDDFRKWRTRNVLTRERRLAVLQTQLTTVSLPLALAIRRAEGGEAPRELHTPEVWDCIAADGSVFNAPSDVREEVVCDDDGEVLARTIIGSRAKDPARARVHHEVNANPNKPHGATQGLFNVAAVTKGRGSYTRVVLGVDIGEPGEGESPIAMRVLRGVYDQAGHTFPVLLYDGAVTPLLYQELTAAYGIYCVNANHARPRGKTEPQVTAGPTGPQTPVGYGTHRYGRKKGQQKPTYSTPLPSLNHHADGYVHQHHLVADDGAVYETNRPAHAGGNIHKTALLRPQRLERLTDDSGEYYLRLTLTAPCEYGTPYEVSYDLRKTPLNSDGHLPWRELVSNIRVLPDALTEQYAEVFGQRNQIESFFSWLERCFWVKDRHASWGRDAQLLDLLGASLLHNSTAWAHLAYRHPHHAQELRKQLNEIAYGPDREPFASSA